MFLEILYLARVNLSPYLKHLPLFIAMNAEMSSQGVGVPPSHEKGSIWITD
jgi:hypothetical protein